MKIAPKQFLPPSGRKPSGSERGWTLVELMVAVTSGSIILVAVLLTTVFVARSFKAMGNYSDLDAASRHTLDVMSRDIRNAAQLTSYATNSITLTNLDGSSFSYTWDPTSSQFTRTTYANAGATVTSTTALLTNCDILTFDIYQRNPTNNFQFVATTGNPFQTKLIDVSWRCSRQIYGNKINTESIQTARIVIRN